VHGQLAGLDVVNVHVVGAGIALPLTSDAETLAV